MDQHIPRLDVPVNHPVAMSVVERLGHVGGDADGVIDRKLMLTVQPLPQTLPLDRRHHVEEEPVGLPGIVQWQNVRVLQVRGGPEVRGGPDLDRSHAALA